MANDTQPEVWLRGPVAGVPPLLQPVAHALLQCREEILSQTAGLTSEQLWARPGGAASIGFHLRHLAGSLDRLLTYARGERLSAAQRAGLLEEGADSSEESADNLVRTVQRAIDRALVQVRTTPLCALDEVRQVGRAGLPSTVRGL